MKPNATTTTDSKPPITSLEADRQVTLAGIHAEKEALSQGGDPLAINALMSAGQTSPQVCGFSLEGIQDGGMTLGCLMALQAMEEKLKWPHPMESIVAGLLCFVDPTRAYKLANEALDEFREWLRVTIWERKLTLAEIREIDAVLKRHVASIPGDAESFQKPVTSPEGTAPAS